MHAKQDLRNATAQARWNWMPSKPYTQVCSRTWCVTPLSRIAT